jgi:hypothetical protein
MSATASLLKFVVPASCLREVATRSTLALVEGVGFEPTKAEPADLQSAPVDHLGTPPQKQAVNFLMRPLVCQQPVFWPGYLTHTWPG